MKKVILVTESGSDLPSYYCDRYPIYIVPMHVVIEERAYDDGVDIQAEDVFNYYDSTKKLPTTSGSTPEDFTKIFDQINQQYSEVEIVYIAYSSVTTVSYNSARIAAEHYENVYLVDSKNVSNGLASVVIAAAQYLESNPKANAQDVVRFVEQIRDNVHFHFLPKTLTYLLAGGRVSNSSYLGAKLLRIFPSIDLVDGYLVAGKKYRGSFARAYKKLIEDFFNRYDLVEGSIRLTEVEGLSQDDKLAIEKILEEYHLSEVEWVKAGAVISCHGGPSAFGIVGISKSDHQ